MLIMKENYIYVKDLRPIGPTLRLPLSIMVRPWSPFFVTDPLLFIFLRPLPWI